MDLENLTQGKRFYDPPPRERIGQPSSADTQCKLMHAGKSYYTGRSKVALMKHLLKLTYVLVSKNECLFE